MTNVQLTSMSSSHTIKRLIKVSLCSMVILMAVIYICTGNSFYSIIFLLGGIVSISGFLLMTKMTDRVLKRRKKIEKRLFFLAGFIKLAIITAVFYLVSRISETAVLFHMLGLSIIFISILVEGIYQFYRSAANGRA
jgi:predicted tellurium resistance membrane protein TerC